MQESNHDLWMSAFAAEVWKVSVEILVSFEGGMIDIYNKIVVMMFLLLPLEFPVSLFLLHTVCTLHRQCTTNLSFCKWLPWQANSRASVLEDHHRICSLVIFKLLSEMLTCLTLRLICWYWSTGFKAFAIFECVFTYICINMSVYRCVHVHIHTSVCIHIYTNARITCIDLDGCF